MLILSFTNEEQKTVWLVTILVSKGHYETHFGLNRQPENRFGFLRATRTAVWVSVGIQEALPFPGGRASQRQVVVVVTEF